MAISVADYLIEQSGIDWPKALASWRWLVPQSSPSGWSTGSPTCSWFGRMAQSICSMSEPAH